MEIYPEKYDQLELSSNEKSFLRTVGRAFDDSGLGYYVLKINPRKKELTKLHQKILQSVADSKTRYDTHHNVEGL